MKAALGFLGMVCLSTLSMAAERKIMGTFFRVTLAAPESPAAHAATEMAFQKIEEVDRTMSEWKPGSALSEVSRNAGVHPVKVPEDLFRLLKVSRDVAEETDGAFDPTWATLWGLWRFDQEPKVPSAAEVEKKRKLVGWKDLILNERDKTAYLSRKGMMLGLGAITKGYALQLAADELRRRGVVNFLLDAGGQVFVGGTNGGRPWRIGVQHPRKPRGKTVAVLEVRDLSVSTSGDYEHSFTKGGVLYHHIIDLKTGFPARGVQSATVIHPDPTLADAYSTACFVLGPEKGIALAAKKGFGLILIDANGKMFFTKSARRYFSKGT